MEGLRPFVVILITASLSSKTDRDARWLDGCVHSGEQILHPQLIASHCCSLASLVLVVLNTSVTMSHKPDARIHLDADQCPKK